jgi:hypothetical protein
MLSHLPIIVIAAIVVLVAVSFINAIRAGRFGFKYVTAAGCVLAAMATFFLYGMIYFPDAPLHPCALYGYCGKLGQRHSYDDYRLFELWYRAFFIIWPTGVLAIIFLAWKSRRKSRTNDGPDR